jgi:hypothetical protein
MASPLKDPKLEALLDRLHAQSDSQVDETNAYFAKRAREGTLDEENFFDADMHSFFSDKMVALDRDKAELCYQLCRSLRASRVVEAGTSLGVSTLYLAAAVRDNGAEGGVAGPSTSRRRPRSHGLTSRKLGSATTSSSGRATCDRRFGTSAALWTSCSSTSGRWRSRPSSSSLRACDRAPSC